MIRRLAAGVKHAAGLHRPGQKLPVRADDILLASYPDSGDRWTQLLIANLLFPNRKVAANNVHRLIVEPDVTVQRDINRVPRPRIIKTHGSFDPRYRRVIYVVRDPRDVVLSRYGSMHKLKTISDTVSLASFVERFLAGQLDRNHGSWGENAGSWLAAHSGYAGFCLLKYEDLLGNAARELARVAEFAGWATPADRISQSVEQTVEMSKTGSDGGASLSSAWQSQLPEPLVARIEAAWGDVMACLGYEFVSRDASLARASSLIELLVSETAGHRQQTSAT